MTCDYNGLCLLMCHGHTFTYSQKKSLYSLYFHSLGSDVSDHFFWSEYRVNSLKTHSIHFIFTPWVVTSVITSLGVNIE